MKEVKVSFNKETWSGDGTHYERCFTITEDLLQQFKTYVFHYLKKYTNQTTFSYQEMKEKSYLPRFQEEFDRFNGRKQVFLTITQRDFFVSFLQEKGIHIETKRACGPFNCYLEIK